MPDVHLGHVHLKVRDVEAAIEFYREVLGLAVAERHARYAFLTFGEHHHDLALQGVGPDAPPGDVGVGLYHTAWELADRDALRDVHETLGERGVRVSPVDHGISLALYFDDPDGNGVETYVDTRADRDREAWAGHNEPYDPTAL